MVKPNDEANKIDEIPPINGGKIIFIEFLNPYNKPKLINKTKKISGKTFEMLNL